MLEKIGKHKIIKLYYSYKKKNRPPSNCRPL